MSVLTCPEEGCGGELTIEVDAAVTYEITRVVDRGGPDRRVVLAKRVDGASELDSFQVYCRDCGNETHLSNLGFEDWQDEDTWSCQQRFAEKKVTG